MPGPNRINIMAKKFKIENLTTITPNKDQKELREFLFSFKRIDAAKSGGTFLGFESRKPAPSFFRTMGVVVLKHGGVILPGISPEDFRGAIDTYYQNLQNQKNQYIAKSFADAGVQVTEVTYESTIGYKLNGISIYINTTAFSVFEDAVEYTVKDCTNFLKFVQSTNIECHRSLNIYDKNELNRALIYLNGSSTFHCTEEEFDKLAFLVNNKEELFEKTKKKFLEDLPKDIENYNFKFDFFNTHRIALKKGDECEKFLLMPFTKDIVSSILIELGAEDTGIVITPNFNSSYGEKSGLFGAYNF